MSVGRHGSDVHDLSSGLVWVILISPVTEVATLVLTLRLSNYWSSWYFIVGSQGKTKPLAYRLRNETERKGLEFYSPHREPHPPVTFRPHSWPYL